MAKRKTKSTTKAKLNQLNETGTRSGKDRRMNSDSDSAVFTSERRKTKRRRQIDPTTCEREYNQAEIEFMHALDEYKRASGRMFPTCSEILEVVRGLGYRQVAEQTQIFNADGQLAAKTDLTDDLDTLDNQEPEAELEEQVV